MICKSHQKISKYQNFLRVWHFVICRTDQTKNTLQFLSQCERKKTTLQGIYCAQETMICIYWSAHMSLKLWHHWIKDTQLLGLLCSGQRFLYYNHFLDQGSLLFSKFEFSIKPDSRGLSFLQGGLMQFFIKCTEFSIKKVQILCLSIIYGVKTVFLSNVILNPTIY